MSVQKIQGQISSHNNFECLCVRSQKIGLDIPYNEGLSIVHRVDFCLILLCFSLLEGQIYCQQYFIILSI